jgi:DNA-binding protein YbaB
MQSVLATESVTAEKGGVTITLNGNLEITAVTIADGMTKIQIEKATMDAVNEAIKKAQKVIAQKMQAMGGLSQFGL